MQGPQELATEGVLFYFRIVEACRTFKRHLLQPLCSSITTMSISTDMIFIWFELLLSCFCRPASQGTCAWNFRVGGLPTFAGTFSSYMASTCAVCDMRCSSWTIAYCVIRGCLTGLLSACVKAHLRMATRPRSCHITAQRPSDFQIFHQVA